MYIEEGAKLFGMNWIVDRSMFFDFLSSTKQVEIPGICGNQNLVSQDWKKEELVEFIRSRLLPTKKTQETGTSAGERLYKDTIKEKMLQEKQVWFDTMPVLEIEVILVDPNKRRRHITSRKDLFCSLDAAPAAGKKVTCANNASYPIKGVGKILITISDGSDLCLPDVLYVPGIKKNLLSVSSLAKNGLRIIFEDDRCIVRDRENGYSLITTGSLENGLFMLDRYEKQIQACIAETKTQAMQDAELWHARFGHVGYGSLMTLQRHNMMHDLSLLEMPPRHVCEGCVLGKMHKFVFSQDGSVRATRKLQLVHSDVCGPMRTPSV
ncbi:hypothetical protein L7F22_064916 [Adiantum nelumboides]|nr:hypothetical protein [Adiantum nelumboides]